MDDLISRQAAIRWVKTECNPYGKPTLDFESGKKFIEHLEQMPSAQPNLQPTCNKLATDTISRAAAIEAHYEYCNKHPDAGFPVWSLKILEDLPSAQPEIVRCKDCKHRDPEDRKCDCGHDILWQLPRQDDWYCADAERRTDGTDDIFE